MNNTEKASEQLFEKTVAAVTGLWLSGSPPLGGTSAENRAHWSDSAADSLEREITDLFNYSINGSIPDREETNNILLPAALKAKQIFCSFYSRPENINKAERALITLNNPEVSSEEKAGVVAEIWAPETGMTDEEIVKRWQLSEVRPNPHPIQPTEVVIQLNALYTLPEPSDGVSTLVAGIDNDGNAGFQKETAQLLRNPGQKIADYDHPVPLFASDENHELINCLQELERDLAFEKQRGVLPVEYKLPVLLSVSVTHENLDSICGTWIIDRIRSLGLSHSRVCVLTEEAVNTLKGGLPDINIDVYSVFGKYGVHFNALKYTQLLLERAYGIRAGFKLDTDEGIRSEDLYKATGKTWLQTLCHNLWGGNAVDWRGRKVTLPFNLGEYINEKDIDRLGYSGSMREPDVKPPKSSIHGDIFFNKGAAHAQATALYNRYDSLEDHISHTVVKGGGYGITNEGLRKAVPFTFSLVGRAEDQQFYFSGIAGNIRGIFHPNLRIAHYKGAVASSEQKTAATRFLGDMYRLVIFQHLADILDIKKDIDPMPGVFAGSLARAQAFFHTIYKALQFIRDNENHNTEYLLTEGWAELQKLMDAIDSGNIKKQLEREREEWKHFIAAADAADPENVKSVLERFLV